MKLFIAVSFSLIAYTSFSQDASLFKGKYLINKTRIEWGAAPQYILPASYDINPAKDHIAITRNMVNNDGTQKEIIEDMKFDGTPNKREVTSGIARASLTWINDTSFKVEKEWTDKEGKIRMKSIETWMKEDGGKTLKVNYDVEQADGNNYTLIGYFDKN